MNRDGTQFRCAAIVTDIEGTTGSIAFVADVLFPYAQRHLADFITRRHADAAVRAALRAAAESAGEPDAADTRIIEILRAWMHEDRKVTALKTLQGLIWAEGYAGGELLGHIYPDAIAGLRRWSAGGIALYVYSSGSIAAQQLLFRHSVAGDLTPLFRGYFDTTIGMKGDADAYRRIAAAIACNPADILFLSDRQAELDAAALAGWQTAGLARAADAGPGPLGGHPTFASFEDIDALR